MDTIFDKGQKRKRKQEDEVDSMKHETQMLNVSKTCKVVVTHCGLFDDDAKGGTVCGICTLRLSLTLPLPLLPLFDVSLIFVINFVVIAFIVDSFLWPGSGVPSDMPCERQGQLMFFDNLLPGV